jgi:hypothetical protein
MPSASRLLRMRTQAVIPERREAEFNAFLFVSAELCAEGENHKKKAVQKTEEKYV